MPEGPEIRHVADILIRAMSDLPITLAWFAFPHLKHYEEGLIGQYINKIESRGKALLIWFSNKLILYSHSQLYGVWLKVKTGETPEIKRSLRVRLENKTCAILLYSASSISMLNTDEIAKHSFLSRIGPDALDSQLTIKTVHARLTSSRFNKRRLGSLLLDQSFIAGLGNYLRSEILWQSGLAAYNRPCDLNENKQYNLCHNILAVPRLSYYTHSKIYAKDFKNTIFQFKVFQRTGKSCERCGQIIKKIKYYGRPFYWCSNCQK